VGVVVEVPSIELESGFVDGGTAEVLMPSSVNINDASSSPMCC
jgi:hypothetical protein